MSAQTIFSPDAPAPIGPYSQGVRAGSMIYTAGQLGLGPDGNLADNVTDQTRQAMLNLRAVLDAGGASFDDVVKTTIFVKDMNDFGAVNAVYGEFFPGAAPARSTVEVARLPKDALVEIEAVAILAA